MLARREAGRRERGRRYEHRADREVRRRAEVRRGTVAVVRDLDAEAEAAPTDLIRVGLNAAVSLHQLHPYAEAYVELNTSSRGLGARLPRLRRFPNHQMVGGARWSRTRAGAELNDEQSTKALSVADRAEVLLAMGDLRSDARTRGMLRQAYRLLGPATRSVEVVEAVLQDALHSGPASRTL